MTDINQNPIKIVEASPSTALTSREVFVRFKAELEKEVDAHIPDLSSEKGRKAIASLAFRVTKAKTSIDAAGKKLIEDARKMVDTVNAERKTIRDELDALADRARKPLTDWEIAEAKRAEDVVAGLAKIRALGGISVDDTSASVLARLSEVKEFEIDPDLYREMIHRAVEAKGSAVSALEMAHARLVREEADRAELARLRAEAESREAVEREAREAARKEREAAESKAKAEAEEAARIAAIEERARKEAAEAEQRKARDEQEAKDRAHREEVARLEREKAEAEAKIRAEADRVKREAEAAKAEQDRIAAEAARRAADVAHRGKIMGAAKEAIMEHGGISEAKAKAIVRAIVGGSVPHTSIQF